MTFHLWRYLFCRTVLYPSNALHFTTDGDIMATDPPSRKDKSAALLSFIWQKYVSLHYVGFHAPVDLNRIQRKICDNPSRLQELIKLPMRIYLAHTLKRCHFFGRDTFHKIFRPHIWIKSLKYWDLQRNVIFGLFNLLPRMVACEWLFPERKRNGECVG